MTDFTMPKLGADMSAGKLIAWHKKPGDEVQRGDVIAEVETDKGVIDVEIFTNGTIERLLIQPGEEVPVGTVLATLREEKAAGVGASVEIPKPCAPTGPVTPIPQFPLRPPTREGSRLRISPSARELARKLGVDATTVQGTGPGGAIRREDIERAGAAKAEAGRSPVSLAAGDRLARMRQTIAAAMTRSKHEIPHYYLSTTIDMHRAMTWLTQENLKRSVTDRLLHGVLFLKAVSLALRKVPELNAVWEDNHAILSEAIHVGVAIALRQGGLIAPALHDTDRQSLGDLMGRLRDLVSRARAGSLRSSELSDSTITVTSLGEQGVDIVYPIIYPPQVAIVGFGKVVERPWVVDGQVVARSVVTATLSADHRVSDGHRGGLFLAAVDRLLQDPSKL